jgi:hypothetical protein
MAESRSGGGSRIALILVFGIALALANAAAVTRVVTGDWTMLQTASSQQSVTVLSTFFETQLQSSGAVFFFLMASPLLMALLAAAVRPAQPAPPQALVETVEEEPEEPEQPGKDALILLRALQDEARFVDFVYENLDAYDDAQVGAAVRSIHAGCRKALAGRVTLRRIFEEPQEGQQVTVEPGFDPAEIRLTGNVVGGPPFTGILQHAGWHASEVRLPDSPAAFDVSVIAPAEVEIA